MDYKAVHLLVAQGLNNLGIFAETANLFEQVDLAFEHVINREINNIMSKRPLSLTSLDNLFLNEFSNEVRFKLEKGEDHIYLGKLSSPILYNLAATITVASSKCTVDAKGRGWYKVTSDFAVYKNTTYKKDELLFIEESDYVGVVTKGEVKKVKTKEIPISAVTAADFNLHRNSANLRYNVPILNYIRENVKVYYRTKYNNKLDSDIPISGAIIGITELDRNILLNWCNKTNLGITSALAHHLIDLVIVYLSITNNQPQQKIVNLKTETIN